MLDKIPVLMRTIHAFYRSHSKPEIVVVLPAEWMDYWTDLCFKLHFHVPHLMVEGGSTRFQSVKNGLEFLEQERLSTAHVTSETSSTLETSPALIAVHDGARPLVSTQLIDESFEKAKGHKAIVPGLKCSDSVRYSENGFNKVLPRDQVFLIQTPQTFQADLLIQAYQQTESSTFTDDASVVEALGIPITLIEGENTNLKITTEEDLALAEILLHRSSNDPEQNSDNSDHQ